MKSFKEFIQERRETEIGITGKPIPNRKTWTEEKA